MALWRTLATLVVFLIVAPLARTQTVTLAEDVKAGDCFAVRLNMKLTGEIFVNKDC